VAMKSKTGGRVLAERELTKHAAKEKIAPKSGPFGWARYLVVISTTALILAMPGAIYSCGPWFDEAIFVPGGMPQTSPPEFAAGKLGIVLPTLRRSYLIVAYRYLSGLKLSGAQQHDAVDVWNRSMGPAGPPFGSEHAASEAWAKAREQVEGSVHVEPVDTYAPVSSEQRYDFFLNCPEDAFKAAQVTLAARVQKYGRASAAVKDWLAAQDQVFSNCDGKAYVVPAVLESADPLLRADRNYQIAAAKFYGRDFDAAAAAFEAVAKDPSSPWAPSGGYLASRALIRKATLGAAESERFNAAAMKAAQQKLEGVLNDPRAANVHGAARSLLDYIRFRTEPAKRVAELEQLMLKPDPGPGFKQHLWDYVLLVSQGEQAEDLSDWVKTFYVEPTLAQPLGLVRPAEQENTKRALAQWRAGNSLPWLVAALRLTDPNDASVPELLEAASKVPAASPGYLSVRYYALRIMARGKQQDAARKELDTLLSRPEEKLPRGSRNLLNDERQQLSVNLADFLTHGAEVPAHIGVAWADGEEAFDEERGESERSKQGKEQAFFTDSSAQVLAQRMPLSLLVESAKSPVLPASLRREVARSTWTRAAVVGNMAVADELEPALAELDNPLWKLMERFRSAKENEDKKFEAALVTLQNPGLSPYVRTGLLRSATLGEIDNYRDNWWCEPTAAGSTSFRRDRDPQTPPPLFLSPNDLAALNKETAKLAGSGVAPNYLTAEVLAFAKLHPEDERVPQALHLAVRSTRYGCTDAETTHWSEKAFRLLHERYPKSDWTEKTKYHF
jgi:hypothetical protein